MGIKRPEVNPLETQIHAGLTHSEQTLRQPVVMRCPNPECREKGSPFDFVSDDPTCPKCGLGPPAVQKRVLIHYIAKDPKGPLIGEHGIRYKIACDSGREFIATLKNGEAGTGLPSEVNCPGCMHSADFLAALSQFQRRLTGR